MLRIDLAHAVSVSARDLERRENSNFSVRMAVAGSPRTVENIKKETTCALCLDLFDEPKTLPACLHTFCGQCLVQAEAARRRLRQRGGETTEVQPLDHVECPQCRSVSVVRGGAERIATNFMYANIVEHLKNGDTEFAVRNTPVAVAACPEPQMCPKHSDEKLKLFCFDCEKLICRDCTVKDHRNHDFEFVQDAAGNEREKLAQLVVPLEEKLGPLSWARESVREARRDLEQVGEEREREISAAFDVCIQKLEEKRRNFLELSRSTTEMKLGAVDRQRDELDSIHTQVSELVRNATQDLQNASDLEIFSKRNDIHLRVKMLTRECQTTNMGPSERDRARFTMDTRWLEDLGEMAELPCPETSFLEYLEQVKPVQNEETTVAVVAQNPEGHALIHGGGVCSAHTVCHPPMSGEIHTQQARVTDNKDGSYTVGFTPDYPGILSLKVAFDRKPICGAPFKMEVLRNFGNMKLEPFSFSLPNANPWGVSLLSNEEIVVTSSDSMAHVYTTRGKLVDLIKSNFTRPYGVCCEGDSAFWVTDREAHNVQKFQRNLHSGKFEKVCQFGLRGVNPGQFSHPRGIAVHQASGLVYVSDMKNHRVQIFSPGYPLPSYRSHFGGPGKTAGLFDLPAGMCFDRHDNLLVCDDRNGRVQLFDLEGRFLRLLGTTSSRKGVLCSPISVACDRHGRYIVTEFGSHTITFMSPEGEVLNCVRNLGFDHGQLVHPRGVACDSLGYIYVADHDNGRVVRF